MLYIFLDDVEFRYGRCAQAESVHLFEFLSVRHYVGNCLLALSCLCGKYKTSGWLA